MLVDQRVHMFITGPALPLIHHSGLHLNLKKIDPQASCANVQQMPAQKEQKVKWIQIDANMSK